MILMKLRMMLRNNCCHPKPGMQENFRGHIHDQKYLRALSLLPKNANRYTRAMIDVKLCWQQRTRI